MIPAAHVEEKDAAAARAGALAVELAANGTTSQRFLDRRALENAMAGAVASGGSTNGFLHLLAIAREAGVPLTLDELAAISASTPVLADLVPGGRFVASDLWEAGGTATLIRELIRRGHVDGAAPTVDGRTLAEATADAPEPDGEVIGELKPRGSLYALRGNLAPEGAVLKLAGTERRVHSGPARVFDDEASCTEAVHAGEIAEGERARRPLRGAGRRPRHARDARPHVVGGRRRAGGVGRARDRRALLRRHARADGRPRRARGGARRPARRGPRRRRGDDRRRRRPPRRRRARRRARAAAGGMERSATRFTGGVFARYAASVGSASDGAVLTPP